MVKRSKKTSTPKNQKKQKVVLSEAGKKEFQQAVNHVWQIIGGDLISCIADSEEKDINSVRVPRDVVIESCLDADYLTTYNPKLSQEVKDFYKSDNYNEMIELAKEVFSFKFYGM